MKSYSRKELLQHNLKPRVRLKEIGGQGFDSDLPNAILGEKIGGSSKRVVGSLKEWIRKRVKTRGI